MVTLSPKCQPKLPVLNSFTWATTVWPLITSSTLLAWALNSLRLIGHSVLRLLKADMVEAPSCRSTHPGGRTSPRRLPSRHFRERRKYLPTSAANRSNATHSVACARDPYFQGCCN